MWESFVNYPTGAILENLWKNMSYRRFQFGPTEQISLLMPIIDLVYGKRERLKPRVNIQIATVKLQIAKHKPLCVRPMSNAKKLWYWASFQSCWPNRWEQFNIENMRSSNHPWKQRKNSIILERLGGKALFFSLASIIGSTQRKAELKAKYIEDKHSLEACQLPRCITKSWLNLTKRIVRWSSTVVL